MSNQHFSIRPITGDEWPGFWQTIAHTFHDDVRPEESELERTVFEPERSLAVFDGDQVVATTGAYSRDLTVPGAVVPAAHVTLVSVLPSHRRRGLLTRMMRRQLQEIRDAAREPVAVLWASEEAIYGRYGYGVASHQIGIRVDTREVRVTAEQPPGRLRLADPVKVVPELSQVYESVRPHRPGFSSRSGAWWEYRIADPERYRKGATARRCVLYETAEGVSGYALWRSKSDWDDSGPNGEVTVEEVVSGDPLVRAHLWRFLLDLDLTRTVSAWSLPVDEPVFTLIDAPRRLNRRLTSALFARVINVPAALAARRYPVPLDLVIEITDDILPDNTGRWRLTADLEQAGCEPTVAPADLRLGIRELGAVYLGGTSLGSLAAAGLVTGSLESIARADAGFGWPQAPFSPGVF